MTKATGTTQLIQSEEILNNEEFGDQLLKMAVGLNNLNDASYWKLGDIRMSVLTEAQFQSKKGDNWVRFKGQDITGSDLEVNFGISTLPDEQTYNYYLGQARSGESIFDLVLSQTKEHSHFIMNDGPASTNMQANQLQTMSNKNTSGRVMAKATANQTIWNYVSGYSGEDEARPRTIGCNFFIKINNAPTNF